MYVVLVPVKPLAVGKSRLVGLSDDDRRGLAEAFALDMLAACLMARRVAQVLVITDDVPFARQLAGIGCATIPDGVAMDLNETLRQAAAEARRRWPELTPVALCADLPALRPDDLDAALEAALDAASEGAPAYVADAAGVGTTLYTAPWDEFDPHYGVGSAAAHTATGARPVGGSLSTLRRDVDDLADLREAVELGVGLRTRQRAALLDLPGDGPSTSQG